MQCALEQAVKALEIVPALVAAEERKAAHVQAAPPAGRTSLGDSQFTLLHTQDSQLSDCALRLLADGTAEDTVRAGTAILVDSVIGAIGSLHSCAPLALDVGPTAP